MELKNAYLADGFQKDGLYTDFYLYYFCEDSKPYERITKKKMYEAVLTAFYDDPSSFECSLDLVCISFFNGLKNNNYKIPKKWKEFFEGFYDENCILTRIFVIDIFGKLNCDYIPIIDKFLTYLDAHDEFILIKLSTYIKGLGQIYGLIENKKVIELVEKNFKIRLKLNELFMFYNQPIVSCFCSFDKKYFVSNEIGDFENFLKVRGKIVDETPSFKEYREYSVEDVIFYSTYHYLKGLNSFGLNLERFAFEFSNLNPAKDMDPYKIYQYGDFSEKEKADYDNVNMNSPKWLLKGHSLSEITIMKNNKEKKIIPINEKPKIRREEFFNFREVIVSLYKIVEHDINIHGDFDTGEVSASDFITIMETFDNNKDKYVELFKKKYKDLTLIQKEVLEAMKLSICGSFIIDSISIDGAKMIDISTRKAYLVRPLGVGFSTLLKGFCYDSMLYTTIFPFRDYITYNFYIFPSEVNLKLKDEKGNDMYEFDKKNLITCREEMNK